MPKHDIPEGDEADSNLIDFRVHLRRRHVDPTINARSKPEPADWELYRHAEYADGKRPRFSRYDLIWIAMILIIGWIIWIVSTSQA